MTAYVNDHAAATARCVDAPRRRRGKFGRLGADNGSRLSKATTAKSAKALSGAACCDRDNVSVGNAADGSSSIVSGSDDYSDYHGAGSGGASGSTIDDHDHDGADSISPDASPGTSVVALEQYEMSDGTEETEAISVHAGPLHDHHHRHQQHYLPLEQPFEAAHGFDHDLLAAVIGLAAAESGASSITHDVGPRDRANGSASDSGPKIMHADQVRKRKRT